MPRSMIGVVIGKGGEMIKKIQQESGARIQFRPEDELGGPNRMCNISGSQEQTQAAYNLVQELVENTAVCSSSSSSSSSSCSSSSSSSGSSSTNSSSSYNFQLFFNWIFLYSYCASVQVNNGKHFIFLQQIFDRPGAVCKTLS